MPYTGSGKNPYWMSLAYNGTPSPDAYSESIPVVVDSVTTYGLTISAASLSGWVSGLRIQLSFYDATSTLTGATGWTTQTNLAPVTQVSVSTSTMTAPANSTYCQAVIEYIGSPTASNVLQVFQASVVTGSNSAQPAIANQNYTFNFGTDPWTSPNGSLQWNFSPLSAADGDFDSLVIGGQFELMGGSPGVMSDIPELADGSGRSAIFRISAPGGQTSTGQGATGLYDLGAPQPTTDVIESLLLDGERPFGMRSSNRTMTIPVMIFAPTLTTLAAAREALLATVDQQTFKLTWRSADSGLTMEYDCFRAQPSVVMYGFNYNRPAGTGQNPATWALSVVTLTFQALPFAKSSQDGTKIVTFLNGTLGGGTYVPGVAVDNFASVSGTGWTLSTAFHFGNASYNARYQAPTPMKMPWAAATYSQGGLTLNLTGLSILTLWFGQSYDTQWPLDSNFVSNVTLAWTLTDANGKTLSFSGKMNKCPWGSNPNKPAWTRISATIPQGKAKSVFDYSKVTGYSVRITNWAGAGTTGYVRMHAWLSQVSASASSTQWVQTPHGVVYSVFGQNYMARSPISAEVQLPAQSPVTHEFTKSNSWTVPRGVTSAFVECFGGGGGGASVAAASGGIGGAGGGGGEYAAEPVVSVIPGTLVPFTIGQGGSGGQVVAEQAVFTRTGPNTWTCPPGVTTIAGYLWGGGAAGGAGAGGGGGGAYTEGNLAVTPGNTYTFTVGAGGTPNTGKLSKDQAARHGGDTVLRGDTAALHAEGGSSPVTGGTPGGAGGVIFTSANTTLSRAGGNGGNSPGSAGGGGGGSGSNLGNGNRGGDSPKGSNNYGTGGPGALIIGGSNGGAGGGGANLNGTPKPGQVPGGGGGGGYSGSTNNNGAAGAAGKIVIKFQVNLGNPVAGTSTVFGAAGLTSKVVTAHGGSSPAINGVDGANGGTGSSNTTHFNGGMGADSGNNSDYLFRANDLGGPFTKLATAGNTAATITTGASSAAQTTGIAVASVVSATALDPQVLVSDSAGNVYDLVATQIISSTVNLTVWAAKIGAPLTTSSTLSVANNGVSFTAGVQWLGSVQYSDIDFATVLANSGTSTAPGVPSISNADIGIHKGYLVIAANNATTAVSAPPPTPASFATTAQATSEFAFGSIDICSMLKEIPGSGATAAGYTATYGSSVAWAAVSVPLIPQNTSEPTLLKVGNLGSTGTTSAIPLTNAFAIPASRGYMVLFEHFAGTPGTITFTDATGNSWSLLTTVTIGSSVFSVYTAKVNTAYATTSTITLNDTTSQAHNSVLYYAHEAPTIDASLTKTATGTSSAPSLTTNAGSGSNDLEVVAYANNNTVDTTSTPAGWVPFGVNSNGAQHSTVYAKRAHGRNTYTPTSSYASSQTWGAIAFGFTNNVLSGSGGASGGPLGTGQDGTDNGGSAWSGGGKGADGLTGATGPGADAAVPGGGGSGAASTDTSNFQGGTGAAGMLRVTWQPPLTTFNDFILHVPGAQSKKSLCPIVPIPPNDPPDNREYPVPALVSGVNAQFWGTYTVLAVSNAWDNPGASRRLSVTVNQYDGTNGPAVSVQATRIITPATDIVNGYVTMGEVTLPVKDFDQSNDGINYTVSIHSTDQDDSFQDILFIDTQGQTVLCNIAPGTAGDTRYSSFYVNEPSNERAMGQVLGSAQGREQSISVLDMTLVTGGQLYLESGENLLVAYSTSGAPDLGVRYLPRWYTDRIS